MGTLYIVSTPIGNLEDITLRALRVLREVGLIAAEDTRHTRRLLDRYEIDTPLISYHEHNERARRERLLAELEAHDVALVSDAGTPAVSDPGYDLVAAAIEAGFVVSPVPGPSATLAALVASGLPTAQWVYLGFLPSRAAERRAFLERYAELPMTLLMYEAPHRLRAALADIRATLGERRLVAARELTKLYEEFVRGSAGAVAAHFEATAPRGEFVLLVEGFAGEPRKIAADARPWQEIARERLTALAEQGASGTGAAKQVAKELGVARAEVYAVWIALRGED